MITILNDLPGNVAGFRASGEVTKDDYKTVVEPHVEELVSKTGELNFLLQLDTDVENFTMGAWLQDALLGIRNITKWHRAAIVTDSETIIKLTSAFSFLIPGEFKGFKKAEYAQAALWVAS
jgi:stage II sporulation SpoAA-like protein